jgi:DNA-directed RNA polymerase alpha subunit
MTQDMTTVTPEIQAAINSLYQQGFEAGRLRGYKEGIAAAREHLLTLVDTTPTGMDSPKLALDTRIEALEFTLRTYNCFKREGVHTIGDLIKRSEASLYDIRNFGVKSIDEVKAKLGKIGYDLAPSPPGFDQPPQ